ncbi:MAG: hypothetical protein JO022_13050, partial [Acidobacteriaceae bacterium]|nr:hypothetical protein [Acidobacteriaceae bacterium]
MVRSGFASWLSLPAVALAGLRAAWFLLPAAMQRHVPGLVWFAVPLEIWVLALVARRPATSRLLRTEWEVIQLALFSWRARPETRPGDRAYEYAEASGWTMFATL